ncbi:Uncharacterised protein [Actinobacillus pleuropneumoniae]|nr:Uncharacterised protein [Actinobacillus pleuropneumoniae]
MTKLDDYGIELLTNEEVIAVNQAGRPAHPVSTDTEQQVWYANNGDGSYTVGLFNLGEKSAEVAADWKSIGLEASAAVRDLWSRSDLGMYKDGLSRRIACAWLPLVASNGARRLDCRKR